MIASEIVKNTDLRVFTEFLQTFYGICADFYRLLSSLQTFIEFFDFKYSFLLLFFLILFIEFIEFYGFLSICSKIYVFFCTDFP